MMPHSAAPPLREGLAAFDDAQLARVSSLLPMSPTILVEVQQALDDGVSGAPHLSRIVRRDPALVVTILRLINSAFYGLPQQITRPTTAIAYLGNQEIYRLVITASVVNTFRRIDRRLLESFWRHATLTALLTRDLTRARARWLSTSVAWTLGLLHDVGALACLSIDPDAYARIDAWCAAHHGLPEEAERALGVAPLTAYGAILCREWRLPPVFSLAATGHRTGVSSTQASVDDADYLRFIASASALARLVTTPLRDEVRERLVTRVSELLGIDSQAFWDLVIETHKLRDEAERAVGDLLAS